MFAFLKLCGKCGVSHLDEQDKVLLVLRDASALGCKKTEENNVYFMAKSVRFFKSRYWGLMFDLLHRLD